MSEINAYLPDFRKKVAIHALPHPVAAPRRALKQIFSPAVVEKVSFSVRKKIFLPSHFSPPCSKTAVTTTMLHQGVQGCRTRGVKNFFLGEKREIATGSVQEK
jgi:hypothetical protein